LWGRRNTAVTSRSVFLVGAVLLSAAAATTVGRGNSIGRHHHRTMSKPELVKRYFAAWNAHDQEAVRKLHAPMSKLRDWDGAHGPTNEDVAKGIAGIWAAVPAIQIEIVDVYVQGSSNTCVAHIRVIVDPSTTLKVVDVFEWDDAGLVVSIEAFKAD
jgi:hypothetical protein